MTPYSYFICSRELNMLVHFRLPEIQINTKDHGADILYEHAKQFVFIFSSTTDKVNSLGLLFEPGVASALPANPSSQSNMTNN